MPSDLQVSNIRDLTNANSAISIASDGQITVNQNNPTLTLGSNATLPDGTMCGYTETTTTPTAAQGTDTSYNTLTGSATNYTPVSGSSFVVYDYQTCFVNYNSNSLLHFKFNYDGSEIANTNHGFFAKFDDGDGGGGYRNFRFVLPSWSGSKELKVTYRAHSGSYQGRIHLSTYSGEGTGNDVYVKIYRQTYSVM